jgi:hypothetical protein
MDLEFKLHVLNYRGGPNIRICTDSVLYDEKVSTAGPLTVNLSTDIKFPAKITVEQYGKDMRRDTHLDPTGKIINDKAFYIESVKIGDVLVKNELYHFDFVKDNGEVLKNINYLGFNGKFVIDIDNEDIYVWQANWQKILIANTEEFSYEKFRAEIFGYELDTLGDT